MICPFCKGEGATSTLTRSSIATSTCMASLPGYYDEQGRWVRERDPNWHTQNYYCSRGHHYQITTHEGDPDDVKLISTRTAFPPLTPTD